MLTEDDLRELIDVGAAQAPTPEPLPNGLFHVEPPRVRRPRPRSFAPALGAIAAAVVAFACVGWFLSRNDAQTKFNSVASPLGASESPAATAQGVPSAAAGGGAVAGTGTGVAAPPADSARIVKNGSLEIRVGKDTVADTVNRLTAFATGLGGYVSDTRTTSSAESGAQASATISLRVPAGAFEQLIGQASQLGEVRSTTTSGQDVTEQYTDIEAQLTALGSTRDQLLTVLGAATNVPDILSVQDRITQVQTQIDQLEGQRRLLDDQTSYGTLSVTLLEPGATAAVPVREDDSDLGDAWRKARDTFVDGIEWIVSATGTLALLALVGAVFLSAGWLIYRKARRRII
jgi:hypothetical protein